MFSRIMHCRRAAHEFPLLPFPPQLIVLQLLLPVAICAIVSACSVQPLRAERQPRLAVRCCVAQPSLHAFRYQRNLCS